MSISFYTDICNNPVYSDITLTCGLIAQRNRFLSLLGPPPRYNNPTPYPKNTQFDLNMRRKVEILKYKNNSTKCNQQTKAQRYASIMKCPFQGNTQTVLDKSGNFQYIANVTSGCPNDELIPTLTTSCDVPGPPMYLYYNPNIPLYNYLPNQNAYSILDVPVALPYNYFTSSNILSLNGNNSTFITVAVVNVNNNYITFNLSVPISVYISGQISPDKYGYITNLIGSINLINIHFSVNYINNAVQTNPNYSYNFNTSFGFETSVTKTNKSFNGRAYIGNINISNITVNTSNGFVLDFKLLFNMNFQYDPKILLPSVYNLNYGVLINFPDSNTITEDCSFNDWIKPPYSPLVLNGV